MSRNTRFFVSTLIAIGMLTSVNVEAFWGVPLSPKAQEALDALEGLDAVIEKALVDFNVPGLAVGVVVDGHQILAKGYGYRNVEENLAVTDQTLFAIGSCTKAFTTFAIGTLIEEGLLDWDQPVIDVLPEFRLWDQYATQNLTLRDLVTHRTGIPRHDFMWYNSSHSRKDLLRRCRYLQPTCDIRERYNYGNLSYLIAGLAMEHVAGKPWEDLVSEKILKPLGMKKTNFSLDEIKNSGDYAVPYLERNSILKKIFLRDFYSIGPAASINSNVAEMNSWMKMLLAQGIYDDKPLLSSAALQEMFAAQVIVSGYTEVKDVLFNAYGLGWGIHSYRGHYVTSHDGGPDGYTSVTNILPYDGIGVVILSNKNLINLPRYLSLEILDRILALPSRNWLKEGLEQWQSSKTAAVEEKKKEDLQRKKGTFPSHALEDYVGEYEHPGYGIVRIELVDGKLRAILNGIACLLDHWHYDVFSISEDTEDLIISREGTKFTFRSSIDGEINELAVPYEPKAPEIVFQKKPDQHLSNLAYFRQFVGAYEIYNVTIEVIIRNHMLMAIVPGQPIFELIPQSENEFSVKSMASYTIRFDKDAEGEVEKAMLILPYGAYSAYKRKG